MIAERSAEREVEILNLPWTQTEKDTALAKCRLGLRAWRSKKPMLCLHAVTDEDGHPLENEDESGRRLVNIGVRSLRPVSKAHGTIAMRPSCGTFRGRLTIYSDKLIDMNLMNSLPQTRNLLQAPMGF